MFSIKNGFGKRVIVIAVFLAVLFICSKCSIKEEPIKTGAILSLSGPGMYNGEEVKGGMLFSLPRSDCRWEGEVSKVII